jgi:hypothetical protein
VGVLVFVHLGFLWFSLSWDMIRRVLREQQTAGVIECQGHFYIISTKRFRGNVIMLNEEAQTPEQARCAQTVDRQTWVSSFSRLDVLCKREWRGQYRP